jgi:D-glycero-D-manno-heptose 1,7-bisphosphate phosphatase
VHGRGVFFDRDGVLNSVVWREGRPVAPRHPGELALAADIGEVVRLRESGFRTFVITNQPDVARGLLARSMLTRMMEQVAAAARPDDMRCCTHDDADACACRKPRPGMLLELAQAWDLDLASSYVVGDTWRDMGAARAAGCRTVLLRRDYNAGTPSDLEAGTLAEAIGLILTESGRR